MRYSASSLRLAHLLRFEIYIGPVIGAQCTAAPRRISLAGKGRWIRAALPQIGDKTTLTRASLPDEAEEITPFNPARCRGAPTLGTCIGKMQTL
ncbi:hypothetical protein EVAR_84440_1 [Eumeta japonica]|uniref:Uncharacterized protein n=1 Tax=Eumeta variegata TaxID=151549 RepID=A0A4C1W378_EUMVA|nr:hypothetical protein EVAR_84440_1 [Eumeta japonica]